MYKTEIMTLPRTLRLKKYLCGLLGTGFSSNPLFVDPEYCTLGSWYLSHMLTVLGGEEKLIKFTKKKGLKRVSCESKKRCRNKRQEGMNRLKEEEGEFNPLWIHILG